MKNIDKFYELLSDLGITDETPCKFHIGRGGRFHNSGHRTFKGHEGLNYEWQSLFLGEECGECQDCLDGNPENCENRKEGAFDGGGKKVSDEFGAEFGRIDIDGDYDTTYVCRLDECDDSELVFIAEYHDIDTDLIERASFEYEEEEEIDE